MSNNNSLPTLNGDLYNYELAMSADIAQWVEDAGGIYELMQKNNLSDSDELAEYLNDELFVSDSVATAAVRIGSAHTKHNSPSSATQTSSAKLSPSLKQMQPSASAPLKRQT